ncbi:unnamed protein product [Boreogadus saida]
MTSNPGLTLLMTSNPGLTLLMTSNPGLTPVMTSNPGLTPVMTSNPGLTATLMNVSETPEAVFPDATKNRFRAQRILVTSECGSDEDSEPEIRRRARGTCTSKRLRGVRCSYRTAVKHRHQSLVH